MSLPAFTIPFASQNKCPQEAKLPTALRGRGISGTVNVYTATYTQPINGYNDAGDQASFLWGDFLPRIPQAGVGQDVLGVGGVVSIRGLPTKLDSITRSWNLFTTIIDNFQNPTFDPHEPASYAGQLIISNNALPPQDSGYPGSPMTYTPGAAFPDDFGGRGLPSGVTQIPNWLISATGSWSGPAPALGLDWTWNRTTSGPVDNAALYQAGLTAFNALPIPFSGTAAVFACGWNANPSFSGSGSGVQFQRQMGKLVSIPQLSYAVIRIQGGLNNQWTLSPILPTDIIARVSIVSMGIIHNGQTIGCAVDNPDIVIPFPDPPFPIVALGTNGIFNDFYQVVFGGNVYKYIAGLGFHVGDNY